MALHPELQTERSTLTIFEQEVTLERVAGVFTPTPHGLFYANAAYVRAGERVIDIGTGSGVIAIAAAKVGARAVQDSHSTVAVVCFDQAGAREFTTGAAFAKGRRRCFEARGSTSSQSARLTLTFGIAG